MPLVPPSVNPTLADPMAGASTIGRDSSGNASIDGGGGDGDSDRGSVWSSGNSSSKGGGDNYGGNDHSEEEEDGGGTEGGTEIEAQTDAGKGVSAVEWDVEWDPTSRMVAAVRPSIYVYELPVQFNIGLLENRCRGESSE